MKYPASLQEMIDAFCRFPGIGAKTAQRLSFFLLSRPREEVEKIAMAMINAKNRIRFCNVCNGFTEAETCDICAGSRRDSSLVCIVQDPRDVMVVERTSCFHGRYHVLHGVLSPIDGIGPEELKIPQLLERIKKDGVKEVVVATNPNVEGDATAVYLSRAIKPLGVKVTRIAFGLPVGGDLEYADELTLGRALSGRVEID